MPDVKLKEAEGRRARSARRTRLRILAAAHELFLQHGYATTTIQEIAERADVAWQTIYSVFGNKPAVLAAVFDSAVSDVTTDAADQAILSQLDDVSDPHQTAIILARYICETGERTASIVGVISSNATTDPGIARLWLRVQAERRQGMAHAIARFAQAGILRSDLSADRATVLLCFLIGPWAFQELVTEHGWTAAEFESWMAETLYSQLFAPNTLAMPSRRQQKTAKPHSLLAPFALPDDPPTTLRKHLGNDPANARDAARGALRQALAQVARETNNQDTDKTRVTRRKP